MRQMQQGPFSCYLPYTRQTDRLLASFSELDPRTLAVMRGSSFAGDSRRQLHDLALAVKEVFDAA
jgi:hypothetical protein